MGTAFLFFLISATSSNSAVPAVGSDSVEVEASSPYVHYVAILNKNQGENLAYLKRQALLRLAESDTIESLRILHQYYFLWTREPKSLMGLSEFDAKNLRYFVKSLLSMKKSSDRLAQTDDKPIN